MWILELKWEFLRILWVWILEGFGVRKLGDDKVDGYDVVYYNDGDIYRGGWNDDKEECLILVKELILFFVYYWFLIQF